MKLPILLAALAAAARLASQQSAPPKEKPAADAAVKEPAAPPKEADPASAEHAEEEDVKSDPAKRAESADQAAPAASAPANRTAAEADAMRKRLDTILPVGQSQKNVLYPKYLPLSQTPLVELDDGTEIRRPVWEFVLEAAEATRLDADHLAFRKARFLRFSNQEDPSQATEAAWLESGIYDVQNDLLMSDQPVRIEQNGMQIEGNCMLLDRKTGLMRMTGKVRMRLFDKDAAEETPEAPAEGKDSAPAAGASSSEKPAPADKPAPANKPAAPPSTPAPPAAAPSPPSSSGKPSVQSPPPSPATTR